MKRKYTILSIILLFIVIFGAPSITFYQYKAPFQQEEIKIPQKASNWAVSPFVIDGNAGWDTFNSTYPWVNGAGTFNDPYVIENLTINVSGGSYGIIISASDAYFIVRNCTIFNATLGDYASAITLDRTINGKFIENNCSFCKIGIYFEGSSNNTIQGNFIHNNTHGIALQQDVAEPIALCDSNIIKNNRVWNNLNDGIDDLGSNNTLIQGNEVFHNGIMGIRGTTSNHSKYIDNHCYENYQVGMYLSPECHNNEIIGNNCSNNYHAGLSIQNSNDCSVYGNIFNDNGIKIASSGISAGNINDCIIIDNECKNNNEAGITISGNNNEIIGNNCSFNDDGIRMSGDFNNFSLNTCNNNTYNGIFLTSGNDNIVTWNTLLGNGVCIYDLATNTLKQNNTCYLPTNGDEPPPDDGNPPPGIPGYDLYFVIGTIGVISVFLAKKKIKL